MVGPKSLIIGLTVAAAVVMFSPSAEAKLLPVDRVAIATLHPVAGHPIQVVVTFGDGFDLGDYARENAEVSVLPVARTDALGWPLDRRHRGVPIHLHRVGHGVYRSSFVVSSPGHYSVVDWSALYAKESLAAGAVVSRAYPPPQPIQVQPSTPGTRHDGSNLFTRSSADETVVVARRGAFPMPPGPSCRVTTASPRACASRHGAQFDFSAPGFAWYRLTLFNADFGNFTSRKPAIVPVSLPSAYLAIGADGSTFEPHPTQLPIQLAAFHTHGIAKVQLRLASGQRLAMTPIHGWTAFAAIGTDPSPFRVQSVEGFNSTGKRVATSVVFRCC